MLGKTGENRMTEDEMVGWHHQLDGYEFEQALGVGDGQGGLACCSPWGHKELDTTTEQLSLSNTTVIPILQKRKRRPVVAGLRLNRVIPPRVP